MSNQYQYRKADKGLYGPLEGAYFSWDESYLASLPRVASVPSSNWKDGEIVEEGKDFEFGYQIKTHKNADWTDSNKSYYLTAKSHNMDEFDNYHRVITVPISGELTKAKREYEESKQWLKGYVGGEVKEETKLPERLKELDSLNKGEVERGIIISNEPVPIPKEEETDELKWVNKKPEFNRECTFVTRNVYRRNSEPLEYEYNVWQIKKLDGENDIGERGWYWGLLNGDGEEWGDLDDLRADWYLILPPEAATPSVDAGRLPDEGFTKSGIPEYDDLIMQFVKREIGFLQLTDRLWNKALNEGYKDGKTVDAGKDTFSREQMIQFAKFLNITNWCEKETWGKYSPPSIPEYSQLLDEYLNQLNKQK